ncbi:unnamed protein product [Heterosigma akashiwo]
MPRCCSTAMMYSFAQRSDTSVNDEPTYAWWLAEHPEVERKGTEREDTLAWGATDLGEAARRMRDGRGRRYVFNKHISKMLGGLDAREMVRRGDRFVFLVRHPLKVLTSWLEVQDCSLEELGVAHSLLLYNQEAPLDDGPVVVDTDALRAAPERTLRRVCAGLGLPWDPAMLAWPAGPKPFDGPWAVNWWVRGPPGSSSPPPTGGTPSRYRALPPRLYPVLELAMPFYQALKAAADAQARCRRRRTCYRRHRRCRRRRCRRRRRRHRLLAAGVGGGRARPKVSGQGVGAGLGGAGRGRGVGGRAGVRRPGLRPGRAPGPAPAPLPNPLPLRTGAPSDVCGGGHLPDPGGQRDA